MTANEMQARVGVDIGGTFTDVALERGGQRYTVKVLTTPHAPEAAVLTGLQRVIEAAGCRPEDVAIVIHGTTLATNALIERKGARTALITTAGFRDVLEMGDESRFEQYDLNIRKPTPLIPRYLRFAVPERMGAQGQVLLALDTDAVAALVPALCEHQIESLAVAFMHSYVNAEHEQQTAAILKQHLPELNISVSSQVSPEIREYERFSTTCANAYVQPMVAGYLERLESQLHTSGYTCPMFLMLSNGGITEPATARRFPIRLVESGPAGGVILAAHVAAQSQLDKVVSFDMGGTTAKICLIDDAKPQTSRAFEVARVYRFKPGSGLPVRVPVVEMVEIGAGGGSIAGVDTMKRITVGPESAGSDPGPACYAQGGELPTVTDANVVLGRIAADGFAGGNIALDPERARTAMQRQLGTALGLADEYAAYGITEIVDENMANAAREHATENGKSVSGRTLIAFGGSAPIHAARLAEKLNIDTIVIPRNAGVGSAVGFLRAPVAYEVSRTAYERLAAFNTVRVNAMFAEMSKEAHAVVSQGAPQAERHETRMAYMRYVGQGHELPVPIPATELVADDAEQLKAAYNDSYQQKYGRMIAELDVEVMSWTLSVSALADPWQAQAQTLVAQTPANGAMRSIFDARNDTRVDVATFQRAQLQPGARIRGPAFITEDETTTVVSENLVAEINAYGDIVMTRINTGA